MKKALFTSKNLIGDGLQASRALNQWHREYPEYEIVLRTDLNHVTPIYERMGLPLVVATTDEMVERLGPYEFTHVFDPSRAAQLCEYRFQEWAAANLGMRHPGYIRGAHIAEAYAALLGVQLPEMPQEQHLLPIFKPTPEEIPKKDRGKVLVSMFSASCSSRKGGVPNKMLPWEKWGVILRWMRDYFDNDDLRFLGAPEDRAPELAILENEYWTGIPLNRLAWLMQAAKYVVTIDNGMSHLAASQCAKMVTLYPACLGLHFIVPYGNPNLYVLQMEPNLVDPASIVDGLRKTARYFRI